MAAEEWVHESEEDISSYMGIAGILLMLLGFLLIIPFGIAVRYFYRSLRQLYIGDQEPGQSKQQRNVGTLVFSFLVMVVIATVWYMGLWWFHWI